MSNQSTTRAGCKYLGDSDLIAQSHFSEGDKEFFSNVVILTAAAAASLSLILHVDKLLTLDA